MSSEHDNNVIVEKAKPKLKQPNQYKVVMLNDDYTPMEFVIEVLQQFFNIDVEKATQIMLLVHTQGKAVRGIYTKDIAETRARQVIDYARQHGHPLLADVEQA